MRQRQEELCRRILIWLQFVYALPGVQGFDRKHLLLLVAGNAPVTKGLLLTSALSSVAWQATSASPPGSTPSLLRAIAQLCAFQNAGELLFGVSLLYYFRVLERQSGSAKFGSFALVVSGLSWGLHTSLHLAYGWQRAVPSTPYGLIFACFVPFIFDIPPSTQFTLFGADLSDKVGGMQGRNVLGGIWGPGYVLVEFGDWS